MSERTYMRDPANIGCNWIEFPDYSKVIRGKKYSTKTAENWWYLGFKENDDNSELDVARFLCQKNTGEYFLYAITYGNYTISIYQVIYDRTITPLTEEEAKEIVAKYCDADRYEEIFDEITE